MMSNDDWESIEGDIYEPDENEMREIEEIINKEEQKIVCKNRLFFNFNTEDHWVGWLRIHGIKWN